MGTSIGELLPQILSWKNKFSAIYYIVLMGELYIFRPLTRNEYLTNFNIQTISGSNPGDSVLKTCLLYPEFKQENFDSKLAGEVDSLVSIILAKSGFSETDRIITDLDKYRSEMVTLENQMIILICKAFPHLTLFDVDNFTYEELLRYIAISEAILDIKLNIEKPKPKKDGVIDFEEENKPFNEGRPKKDTKRTPQ